MVARQPALRKRPGDPGPPAHRSLEPRNLPARGQAAPARRQPARRRRRSRAQRQHAELVDRSQRPAHPVRPQPQPDRRPGAHRCRSGHRNAVRLRAPRLVHRPAVPHRPPDQRPHHGQDPHSRVDTSSAADQGARRRDEHQLERPTRRAPGSVRQAAGRQRFRRHQPGPRRAGRRPPHGLRGALQLRRAVLRGVPVACRRPPGDRDPPGRARGRRSHGRHGCGP